MPLWLAVPRELQPITGDGPLLFSGPYHRDRTMSEKAANPALRTLGYSKEHMAGPGFLSTALTLLNEKDWNRDAR